jgi:hypothetical protein
MQQCEESLPLSAARNFRSQAVWTSIVAQQTEEIAREEGGIRAAHSNLDISTPDSTDTQEYW